MWRLGFVLLGDVPLAAVQAEAQPTIGVADPMSVYQPWSQGGISPSVVVGEGGLKVGWEGGISVFSCTYRCSFLYTISDKYQYIS